MRKSIFYEHYELERVTETLSHAWALDLYTSLVEGMYACPSSMGGNQVKRGWLLVISDEPFVDEWGEEPGVNTTES